MNTKYNKILKICFEKFNYLNYAENTIHIYIYYIEKFLINIDKYPQHLTAADFQNYLNTYSFSSVPQQNQIINAIKFLYEKILNKKYNKIDFSRPKAQKKLPRVIESKYLKQKIHSIKNLKHKSILMLAYSVGLRVSEVINLKIEHIDSRRMIIHINQAKGRKDRIVPLSMEVLKTLREYYKKEKPKIYLFNGQKKLRYSPTSCNNLVKKYLGNNYHFHLLRHSCFTALLEKGTDLRVIQKIAGHSSSQTTEIYTHVSNKILNKVALPI